MKCPKCGAEIEKDSVYCGECGVKVQFDKTPKKAAVKKKGGMGTPIIIFLIIVALGVGGYFLYTEVLKDTIEGWFEGINSEEVATDTTGRDNQPDTRGGDNPRGGGNNRGDNSGGPDRPDGNNPRGGGDNPRGDNRGGGNEPDELGGDYTSEEDIINIVNEFFEMSRPAKEIILELTALSDEEEKEIGDELYQDLLREITVTKDPQYTNRVMPIYNSLIKYRDRKALNYTLDVVVNNEVNAYATPGGHLLIYTGLIDYLDDQDELAAVLSHEIGHVELGHTTELIQMYMHTQSLTQSPDLAELVNFAYNTLNVPYSKYNELDADEYGVHLMEKAGYNRQGMYDLMQKFMDLEGDAEMNEFDKFFSTHPPSKERRDKVKTY